MRRRARLTIAAALALLAACTVGPDYRRPAVSVPAAYKELPGWKTATPRDGTAGPWWRVYGDPDLDRLVAALPDANQDLRAAEARHRQAMAVLAQNRAAWSPTVGADGALSHAQDASVSGFSATPRTTTRLELTASWELDLWGRIRRLVEAGAASEQASAADYAAALLSAQGTLVSTYLALRANEADERLLRDAVAAYERALEITRNRYRAGVVSRLDVAQAETQLKATRAQAIDQAASRAQLEHAIALLLGRAPADFSLARTAALPPLPAIPAALPSALLERRPDIAAAERRAAAANANIGVAKAAYFPTLSLGGAAGVQSVGFADLLAVPARFWSVGPTLAGTLFDGGLRRARTREAEAAYDAAVANYRQTVLAGFSEIEDQLASLRVLADEAIAQAEAVAAARQALDVAMRQYQAGTESYLTVVVAQTNLLNASRTALAITARRLAASATLARALGGDWRAEAIARAGFAPF